MTKIYEHPEFYNINFIFDGEIWKQISDACDGYLISNFGRVKSQKRKWRNEKLLSLQTSTDYPRVAIATSEETFKGRRLRNMFLVHRLMAIAFIPNPNNLPEVNHKNGIKHDLALSNLEWVTKKENADHAYAMGLNPRPKSFSHAQSKPIVQLGNFGEIIRLFGSTGEVERAGFSGEGARKCAQGDFVKSKGFRWRWATPEEVAEAKKSA